MSSLTAIEKRALEKLLGMNSGYVLDFSNRTFQKFVLEVTDLDIDREEIGGTGSKAARLRFFWKTQPDHIVGKLLGALVEYVETESLSKDQSLAIAKRLLGARVTAPSDEKRIWDETGYRVFLGHKAEVKREAASLKHSLRIYGISAFVAHADIQPTREWQEEILNALASMDAFIALLTPKYHQSFWTDQEVGYAVCRGVPLIAVKLGRDPYGFIGKFQALSCGWEDAPLQIAKLLVQQPRMLNAYIDAVSKCETYEMGNIQAGLLPTLQNLAGEQVERLVEAFNKNSQVDGCYGFRGNWPSKFGSGLAYHLTRITGKSYECKKSPQPGKFQISAQN